MTFLPKLFRKPQTTSLEDLFSFFSERVNGWQSMRIDIEDKPDAYIIKADLPGVKKEDINVSLTDQVLTIEVEHSEETQNDKDTDYIVRERQYHSLVRSIPLRNTNSSGDVKAEFKDGVLSIKVKKSPEKQSDRIAIQ